MAPPSKSNEDAGGDVLQAMGKLKSLYIERVRPIERHCHFVHFSSAFPHVRSTELTASELEAKPQVLLIGQYSTGKTTLVKWLTGIESKEFDIRPQPSTDKFIAVVHGAEEKVINGDAACCVKDLPYGGLAQFGHAFLSKFQVLVENAPILQQVSFIDTPGVLSGDKQRLSRGYDFGAIAQWLSARSDLVLLLFDAHKLDISDEFRGVIESIRGAADKCRCVLNKADEIDGENLVKVNGALMWNLGRILNSPEVARMYVGSFWDGKYKNTDLQKLLDRDRQELVQELKDLPRSVCVRRINEVVLRTRTVKVQMAIGAALRSHLPHFGSFCGRRSRRQRWLCNNLPVVFDELVEQKRVVRGDLPSIAGFRERLLLFKDFSQFARWDASQAAKLDTILFEAVPHLMASVGGVTAPQVAEHVLEPEAESFRNSKKTPLSCFTYYFGPFNYLLVFFVIFLALLGGSFNMMPSDTLSTVTDGFGRWLQPAADRRPPVKPASAQSSGSPNLASLASLWPFGTQPVPPPPPPPKGIGTWLADAVRSNHVAKTLVFR